MGIEPYGGYFIVIMAGKGAWAGIWGNWMRNLRLEVERERPRKQRAGRLRKRGSCRSNERVYKHTRDLCPIFKALRDIWEAVQGSIFRKQGWAYQWHYSSALEMMLSWIERYRTDVAGWCLQIYFGLNWCCVSVLDNSPYEGRYACSYEREKTLIGLSIIFRRVETMGC